MKPEVYSQFILTLKRQEHMEITMEQMKLSIEEILKPYPELRNQFKRFDQSDRVSFFIPFLVVGFSFSKKETSSRKHSQHRQKQSRR